VVLSGQVVLHNESLNEVKKYLKLSKAMDGKEY
jgi:hypothetical protein